MTFDTRSSWGAPQTLSLRLSSVDLGDDGNDQLAHADESGTLHYSSEVGFCWVDLRPLWARINQNKSSFATVMCHAQICSLDNMQSFDEHGDLSSGVDPVPEVRRCLCTVLSNYLVLFLSLFVVQLYVAI